MRGRCAPHPQLDFPPLFSVLNTSMENVPSTVSSYVKATFCLFLFEMESLVAKAGLELLILLPPPPSVDIEVGAHLFLQHFLCLLAW